MKGIPTARDFMTTKFVSVTPEMSVFEAIDLLVRKKVSGVPVIDAEGKLRGVLTAKDCIRVLANAHMSIQNGAIVENFMSVIKFRLEPSMDLFAIATEFMKTNINTLPVIEGEELVGIIARQDMLKTMREMYKNRGLDFMHDENQRRVVANPTSIEDFQTLAGTGGRDQLASVFSRRHTTR